MQGTNARKVISEVYTFFVLQCTVFGRKVNTRWMSQSDRESIFTKKIMKCTGHWKLLCEFSKSSKLNAFDLLGYKTNTDASILVYKVRPERTGFNMYAEYTRPQLTFLALIPWNNVGVVHLCINTFRIFLLNISFIIFIHERIHTVIITLTNCSVFYVFGFLCKSVCSRVSCIK